MTVAKAVHRPRNRVNSSSTDKRAVPHLASMQLLSIAILVLSVLVFLVNIYRCQNLFLDDAYITYHYARHLVEGQGLTWNVAGEAVEGYTSLLHILLIAVSMKLGIRPELSSPGIAVGSVLATVGLLLMILRRQFRLIYPGAAVALGIYLVDETTALNSTNGLETQLYVLLLCWGYAAALIFIDSPTLRNALGLGLAVFLSVLGRPEGILCGLSLYMVLGGYLLLSVRRKPSGSKGLSYLLLSATLVILSGLGYASWKYQYFGYLLPNSFYVKSNQISLSGLDFVRSYLAHVVPLLGPLVLGSALFVGRKHLWLPFKRLWSPLREPKAGAKILLTLVPPALALTYYVTITHDVGEEHRFSYPTYFYLVMATASFASLATRSKSRVGRQWLTTAVACMMILYTLATSQWTWKGLQWPVGQLPVDVFNQYQFKIAHALQKTGLQSRATVLNDAAGIVPYFSRFNQVDLIGLNENFLSGRFRVTGEERERYLWSRRADVYVGHEVPAFPGAQGPENDPRMRTRYVAGMAEDDDPRSIHNRVFARGPRALHYRMRELRDGYYCVGEIEWPGWELWRLKSFAYVRKDSPYFDRLVRALREIVAREPGHTCQAI